MEWFSPRAPVRPLDTSPTVNIDRSPQAAFRLGSLLYRFAWDKELLLQGMTLALYEYYPGGLSQAVTTLRNSITRLASVIHPNAFVLLLEQLDNLEQYALELPSAMEANYNEVTAHMRAEADRNQRQLERLREIIEQALPPTSDLGRLVALGLTVGKCEYAEAIHELDRAQAEIARLLPDLFRQARVLPERWRRTPILAAIARVNPRDNMEYREFREAVEPRPQVNARDNMEDREFEEEIGTVCLMMHTTDEIDEELGQLTIQADTSVTDGQNVKVIGARQSRVINYTPLGLVLEIDNFTVRRDGYPNPVQFKIKSLAWDVVHTLVLANGGPVPTRDLGYEVWHDETTFANVISTHIGEARKLLQDVGVTIPDGRGSRGYSLVDMDQQ